MENDCDNFGRTEIGLTDPTGEGPIVPTMGARNSELSAAAQILDCVEVGSRTWAATLEEIDPILENAANWNVDANFFDTQERKLTSALDHTYPLFLVLAHRGREAVAALKNHPSFADRMRGPNLGNPALAALELMLKPDSADRRKTCSEYACKLIWANEHDISPYHFQARCREVSLKQCKTFVRELRRRRKCPEAGIAHACQAKIRVIAETTTGKSVFNGFIDGDDYSYLLQRSSTLISSQSVHAIIDIIRKDKFSESLFQKG